jgi:septum formation protein
MLHEILKDKKLVLASASPRRQEIFRMLGLNPLVCPAHIHEPLDSRLPHLAVKNHAQNKAVYIATRFDENTVIVAADTLVYIDQITLGKPLDQTEAEMILKLLSGKIHTVYTGVCIKWRNQVVTDYAKSRVCFKELSDLEIDSYIKTGEPLDKAGAYGIQGYGSQFIKEIQGCYFNVMGFPVNLFYTMLMQLFTL